MKVKELVRLLKLQDQDAEVEIEMDDFGDRSGVVQIMPTIYNSIDNKRVVIMGDR